MYTSSFYPGFCGGRIISGVSGITSKQIKQINDDANLYGMRSFVVLLVRRNNGSGNTQIAELERFKAAGWKPHGAKFRNKRTGNTVQMFSYTPVRNKRSEWITRLD